MKYHSQPQMVDGYLFPSRYEARIYQLIDSAICTQRDNFRLTRQIKVSIYNGDLMPARDWKCDFALTDLRTKKSILIEAKGIITRDFRYIMNLLASNNIRAFTNLIVVSDNGEFNAKHWGTLRTQSTAKFADTLRGITIRGIHGNFTLQA